MRAWGWLVIVAGCAHPVPPAAPPPVPAPPPDALAWHARARYALAAGDAAEADRASAWLVRVAPDDPRAWRERAVVLAALDRPADADAAFREGLTRGDDASLRASYGLFLEAHDPDRAREVLASAAPTWEVFAARARLGPPSADLWRAWAELPVPGGYDPSPRAALALQLGDPEGAVDDLVASVSRAPTPLTALVLVEAAATACRVDAAWAWASSFELARRGSEWGRVIERLGLVSADPELLIAAAKLDGHEIADGLELARALAEVGHPEVASELVSGLRARQAGRPDLDVAAARLAHQRGRAGAAELLLERVPADDPGGCALRSARARAAGRLDEARAALAPCDGDDAAELRAERARVAVLSGQPPPDDAPVTAVVEALVASDRAADAVVALRVAVAADPTDLVAWRWLVRLDPASSVDAVRAHPCDPDLLVAAASYGPLCDGLPLIERAYANRPGDDALHALRSARRAACRDAGGESG
jgi:tetratricopeptide (TPR) repeat protein